MKYQPLVEKRIKRNLTIPMNSTSLIKFSNQVRKKSSFENKIVEKLDNEKDKVGQYIKNICEIQNKDVILGELLLWKGIYLLDRIVEYRDNYTYWVVDFGIPLTNNISERALRGVKTKMKVSGQFQNLSSAEYYANIRSYIETCHRNGINELEALQRLASGNPFTLSEILNNQKN